MPPLIIWSVQTHWPRDPRHVGDARRFVVERLLADHLDDVADTVGLIVSELATNAVKHAESHFRVTVVRDEDRLLVEVLDDTSTPPSPREPDALDVGGRGLQLVDALSQDWGVRAQSVGGKCVWVALDVTPADLAVPRLRP